MTTHQRFFFFNLSRTEISFYKWGACEFQKNHSLLLLGTIIWLIFLIHCYKSIRCVGEISFTEGQCSSPLDRTHSNIYNKSTSPLSCTMKKMRNFLFQICAVTAKCFLMMTVAIKKKKKLSITFLWKLQVKNYRMCCRQRQVWNKCGSSGERNTHSYVYTLSWRKFPELYFTKKSFLLTCSFS